MDVDGSSDPRSPEPDANRTRKLFEEFSCKYAARALKYVRMKLGATLRRRMESDDVLQEVLLKATRLYLSEEARGGLTEKDFYPRLTAIIDHKIQDLVRFHVKARKRTVEREVSLQTNGGDIADRGEGKTPSAELMTQETSDHLQRALTRLSPREREVVVLVHLKKMRVADAARLLGKTSNATSVLLHHALKKLGGLLKGTHGR